MSFLYGSFPHLWTTGTKIDNFINHDIKYCYSLVRFRSYEYWHRKWWIYSTVLFGSKRKLDQTIVLTMILKHLTVMVWFCTTLYGKWQKRWDEEQWWKSRPTKVFIFAIVYHPNFDVIKRKTQLTWTQPLPSACLQTPAGFCWLSRAVIATKKCLNFGESSWKFSLLPRSPLTKNARAIELPVVYSYPFFFSSLSLSSFLGISFLALFSFFPFFFKL